MPPEPLPDPPPWPRRLFLWEREHVLPAFPALEDVPWLAAYAWPVVTLSSCLSYSSSRRRKERAEAKVCGGDLEVTIGLRWR